MLQLLAKGWSNSQLTRRLHGPPKTIDDYLGALFEKFGVHSRTKAVGVGFSPATVSSADSSAEGRSA